MMGLVEVEVVGSCPVLKFVLGVLKYESCFLLEKKWIVSLEATKRCFKDLKSCNVLIVFPSCFSNVRLCRGDEAQLHNHISKYCSEPERELAEGSILNGRFGLYS